MIEIQKILASTLAPLPRTVKLYIIVNIILCSQGVIKPFIIELTVSKLYINGTRLK